MVKGGVVFPNCKGKLSRYRLLFQGVLHLFMLWSICFNDEKCVAFFLFHLFNTVKMCYFAVKNT